jgi:chromosome segregation ATPase
MDELSNQIENLKTDEDELEQKLNDYDLDEELEAEFDAIDAEFHELEIIYQSLLNTRRFLQDATT